MPFIIFSLQNDAGCVDVHAVVHSPHNADMLFNDVARKMSNQTTTLVALVEAPDDLEDYVATADRSRVEAWCKGDSMVKVIRRSF